MITTEEVERHIEQLVKEMEIVHTSILRQFPMEAYLEDVKSYSGLGRHSYFSRRRKRIFHKILSKYDAYTLSLYNKLALSFFVKDSLEHLKAKNLPSEVMNLYKQWFQRVLVDFSKQPDDYYNHDCYSFLMDLGVCCRRNIPVGGAWVVQIDRVGWRPLIAGGLGPFIEYIRYLLFKMGGFTPFCVIHTVPRYLPRFNQKEMNMAYMRMAELIKLNPKIKGIYRRSWFLDPKLDGVSPDLGYLRKIPQENGAKLFKGPWNPRDIEDALAMSSVRRKLYREGKYMPTGYAYIWPRKEFLYWTDKLMKE